MSRVLFYMPEEIEGREISARFRQGQFYIPKFYKGMFDIREGDYFILKVINRSHANIKHKPIEKSTNSKKDEPNSSSNENRKKPSPPHAPDYIKPFKLLDEDEDTWDNDDEE